MIIGISGKIGSGKDTVGRIIQYLIGQQRLGSTEPLRLDGSRDYSVVSGWKIKKFASKLKQVASILLGIPEQAFEHADIKNSFLGREWDWIWACENDVLVPGSVHPEMVGRERKRTVREFLQLLGTNAIRNVLHQDAWVNALLSDYKGCTIHCHKMTYNDPGNVCSDIEECKYVPNWIITDVRFPNEARAVESHKSLLIRVNRWCQFLSLETALAVLEEGIDELYAVDHRNNRFLISKELRSVDSLVAIRNDGARFAVERKTSDHLSETALDNYPFQETIENDGSLEDLVEKVREVLIKHHILQPSTQSK